MYESCLQGIIFCQIKLIYQKELQITNAKISIKKLNCKQTDIRGEFWLNIFSYFLLNINKELISNIKRVLFWNFLIVEAA